MLATIFSGPDDLIIIVVALVVIFGGSQLPKLARNAGEAMREFKKSGSTGGAEAAKGAAATPVPPAAQPVANTVMPQAVPLPTAPDDRVTLSRAELDALLAQREANVRAEDSGA